MAGDREPKEIREQFKAWCTRRLKALQQERLRPLSAHDSSAAAIRQKCLALESWCAKTRGIHKIGQMLFRSTALWGGGFAYLIDKKARRMHLP